MLSRPFANHIEEIENDTHVHVPKCYKAWILLVINKIIMCINTELHGPVGTFEGRSNLMQDCISQGRSL